MKKTIFIFLFILVAPQIISQNLNTTLYEDMYRFFESLRIKGILEYHHNIKPFSRFKAVELLQEAEISISKLNKIEKEELEYYKKNFLYEVNSEVYKDSIFLLKSPEEGRLNLFEYYSPDFYLNVNPIFTAEYWFKYDSKVLFWNSGVDLFGYYHKNIGFYLNFKDNHYKYQDNYRRVDLTREFSRETGFGFKKEFKTGFDFDEVYAGLDYSWSRGEVGISKHHLYIGSGRGGKIILSDKAPSFPFLYFSIQPVDWIKFDYFHGALQSGALDSNTIRSNPSLKNSFSSIQKYIALHTLSIKPIHNLTLLLGESVIYTEHIKPIYFIPVIFFRLADHYIDDTENAGNNAQIFLDISYVLPFIDTEVYASLFIDELSTRSLLEGGNNAKIGYTVGSEFIIPLFNDISIVLEYTRINPSVYKNFEAAGDYSNRKYNLGHWMGSNADQFFMSVYKKLTHKLSLNLNAEYIRTGGNEIPALHYPSYPPAFLFGEQRRIKIISFISKYQLLHNLFIKTEYQYSEISDENKLRTPDYRLGTNHLFSLGFHYGI